MDKSGYTEVNASTIDRWVDSGWEWGIPISHKDFERAKNGEWSILLTPTKPVPKNWFLPYYRNGALKDVRVLGLASGGGQQMPVMAALGADCTVMDYSNRQLAGEWEVARREGYAIDIVRADMAKALPFGDAAFDIIVHPISNCYVEDVYHVWNECCRVLKKGGLLLAGMDNGVNFLFDDITDGAPLVATNKVPVNPLNDPALFAKLVEQDDGIQFSHTLEEQIGGQLKAGFVLTDIYEDRDATGELGRYFPQYIATRAVKPG